MSSNQIPPDALFIRWGKFQAGASGRVAQVAVVAIVGALLIWAFARF